MAAPLLAAAGKLLTGTGATSTFARGAIGSALSQRQQSTPSPKANAVQASKPAAPARELGQNPAGYR